VQGALRRFHGIRSQRAQGARRLIRYRTCMSARGFLGLPAGAVARLLSIRCSLCFASVFVLSLASTSTFLYNWFSFSDLVLIQFCS
jgi:LSD1 subclass zinc finger protein